MRFRRLVASAGGLLRAHWPNRMLALSMCGRAGIEIGCKPCGAPELVPFRCGARTCPTCNRAGSAKIASRVTRAIPVHDAAIANDLTRGLIRGSQRFEQNIGFRGNRKVGNPRNWKFVTLSCPLTESERWNLSAQQRQVKRVRRAFNQWWRSTEWGEQVPSITKRGKRPGSPSLRARWDTSCVASLEISPGGKPRRDGSIGAGGMVHMHCAIYGEYQPRALLAYLWARALGVPVARAHIRKIRGADTPEGLMSAMQEVVKYSTGMKRGKVRLVRGAGSPEGLELIADGREAEHAAMVEISLRNVHRLSTAGRIRTVLRQLNGADLGTDVRPEDLHDADVLACKTCGCIGEWKWRGIVPPDVVRANGGFGPVTVELAERLPLERERAREDRRRRKIALYGRDSTPF